MKKRILSVILSLSLLLVMLPVTALSLGDSQAADTLYSLGLFRGVGLSEDGTPDYALARTPTRSEAVTMLVRLLGREKEATEGNWVTPFTDVESWALPYVGYAYANGLTSGTSDTTFSGSACISATQYLTLVLRALGYSDGADFVWSAAWELSDAIGLTNGEYAGTASFSRGDIAAISCSALSQAKHNTQSTLLYALLQDGAVTAQQITDTGMSPALTPVQSSVQMPAAETAARELSSEEIYAQCSPAVFYIVVYDMNGEPFATGSGFFINEGGTAVTNYHVIDDAFYMTITMTDGTVYDDVSVLAFDIDKDVAVLQVNGGEAFSCLSVGTSAVSGGQAVYTIGNPEGLTNTISSGLVSNPARVDEYNNPLIQISAPITYGSSGGALLNAYGEVVGITSGGYDEGNLNFAIPIATAMQLTRCSGMTLAQTAAQVQLEEYQNRPAPLAASYSEYEPNNRSSQANYIDNGDSIWGVVDDGNFDTFLVRCYTPGVISVKLFTSTGRYYADDLILVVDTYNYSEDDYAFGEPVYYAEGTNGLNLEYHVEEPGIYQIIIFSSDLADCAQINTDYMFYYTFKPDSASSLDPRPAFADQVQSYESYTAVPDFGDWFGIPATSMTSDDGYALYLYHMYVVDTATDLESCAQTYGWLLAKWGFVYLGKNGDGDIYDTYVYQNRFAGVNVYFGLYEYDGVKYFSIMMLDS